MTEGPVFGSVDRFEGLGVFFDTYDNERAHVSALPKKNRAYINRSFPFSVIHSLM